MWKSINGSKSFQRRCGPGSKLNSKLSKIIWSNKRLTLKRKSWVCKYEKNWRTTNSIFECKNWIAFSLKIKVKIGDIAY